MVFYSLITGSSGLLGKYHSDALLQINHNVVLTDKNLDQLKKDVKFFKKRYPKKRILGLKMDITSKKNILSVLKFLKKKNIWINNLINTAAIDAKFKRDSINLNKFENISLKVWNKEIEVGLSGAMLCSQIFGNEMVKKKIKGNILNIGSDLSVLAPNQNIYIGNKKKQTFIKPVTYSVIKHGIVGLTKYVASYWANKNIRCNCLSPGPVLNKQSLQLQKNLKKTIPLNRLANMNEYVGSIKFLCSDDSKYMTGQNIIIDGGRTIW